MATAPRIEHSWEATEDEIMRLCHYITDDGTVAAYFGTTRERVAKVRAKVAQRRPYLRTGQDCTSEKAINASTQKAEREATEGSAQFRERLWKFYRRFGDKNGLTPDEALVVQLYGWATLHKLKAQAILRACA